jgi:hypothetical protein
MVSGTSPGDHGRIGGCPSIVKETFLLMMIF